MSPLSHKLSISLRGLCLSVLVFTNASQLAVAQLPPPVPAPSWSEAALEQIEPYLEDEVDQTRRQAETLLSQGQMETLQHLVRKQTPSPEYLMRARRIWERITLQILLDSSVSQLQQLRTLIEQELILDPYHPYAESMLKLEEDWSQRIQWAAARWILEQGGDLNFRTNTLRIAGTSLGPQQRVPTSIFLSSDWQGATDTLRPIFDLFTAVDQLVRDRAQIYLIEGAPFRKRDINRMVEVEGVISMNTRGRSRLGISFSPTSIGERGLVVSAVAHLSTAAAAGIRAKDRIVELNGTAITNAESLIEALRQYEVGDVVKVGVIREGSLEETIELKVRLQGWTGEDRSPDPFD